MSEKRKADVRITIKDRDGKPVKIELFRGELWNPSATGTYRLRVDGKWRGGSGSEASFYSLPEFTTLFSKALGKKLSEKTE